MRLPLTPFERLTLVNQYRLLAAASKDERESYLRLADELESGYAYLYSEFPHLQEELPRDRSDFVVQVLALFDKLKISYQRLTDKSGIKATDVVFPGFDGNNEAELLGFTHALARRGQFLDVLGKEPKNSHMPSVDVYQRMLEGWMAIGRPAAPLSADQIKSILAARVHPENRP